MIMSRRDKSGTTFFEDWEIYIPKPRRPDYTIDYPNEDVFGIHQIIDPDTHRPIWTDDDSPSSHWIIGGYVQVFDPALVERMIIEDSAVVNAVYDCASHGHQYMYMRTLRSELLKMFLGKFRERWQKELDEQRAYVESISPHFSESWALWDVQISDTKWELGVAAFRKHVHLIAQWCLMDYCSDPIWESLLAKFVNFGEKPLSASQFRFVAESVATTKNSGMNFITSTCTEELSSGNSAAGIDDAATNNLESVLGPAAIRDAIRARYAATARRAEILNRLRGTK